MKIFRDYYPTLIVFILTVTGCIIASIEYKVSITFIYIIIIVITGMSFLVNNADIN